MPTSMEEEVSSLESWWKIVENADVNRYLVILPDDSTIQPEKIASTFQHWHPVRDTRRTWVIASDDLTCWNVCQKLGIAAETDESKIPTGLVLKIDEVNGYTDAALWQTLRAWSSL